jgi:hypothetical protein
MRTNTAVTLYSRSVEDRAEKWTRFTIPKAHWENRKAANVIASGLLEADSVSVWIPKSSYLQEIKIGDFLVKGIVSDSVDDETFTISDLRKKYSYSVRVTSVDLYDFGSSSLQHVKVGAS